jgi:hypothetical protein
MGHVSSFTKSANTTKQAFPLLESCLLSAYQHITGSRGWVDNRWLRRVREGREEEAGKSEAPAGSELSLLIMEISYEPRCYSFIHSVIHPIHI